jgi:hypothetical protein
MTTSGNADTPEVRTSDAMQKFHAKIYPMARLDQRQRGNEAKYDPENPTPGPYRPTAFFPPDLAVKVTAAADALGISVSGLLRELVRRMPVDEHGRPIWDDTNDPDIGMQLQLVANQ